MVSGISAAICCGSSIVVQWWCINSLHLGKGKKNGNNKIVLHHAILEMNMQWWKQNIRTELILGLHPANERRCRLTLAGCKSRISPVRTQIRFWTHNRQPISHPHRQALELLLWVYFGEIGFIMMKLHCIFQMIYLSQKHWLLRALSLDIVYGYFIMINCHWFSYR